MTTVFLESIAAGLVGGFIALMKALAEAGFSLILED